MPPISRRQILGLFTGFFAPQIRAVKVAPAHTPAPPQVLPPTRLSPFPPESPVSHVFFPDADPTDPSALESWLRLPMQPLIDFKGISSAAHTEQERFLVSLILEQIKNQTGFEFRYLGGSEPGTARRVLPILLFRKFEMAYDFPDIPHIYLLAFCHTRQQARTFRLDRISPILAARR